MISYDTERKKVGTKVRFSLRKFLGLTKEGVREGGAPPSPLGGQDLRSGTPPQPRPRPRLEIIHPSDLSGTSVEVLRGSGLEVRRQLQEAAEAAAAAAQRRNSDTSLTPTPTSPTPPAADYGDSAKGSSEPIRSEPNTEHYASEGTFYSGCCCARRAPFEAAAAAQVAVPGERPRRPPHHSHSGHRTAQQAAAA